MVAEFQHGLSASMSYSSRVTLSLPAALAAIWLRLGVPSAAGWANRCWARHGRVGDRVHVRDSELGPLGDPGEPVPRRRRGGARQVRGRSSRISHLAPKIRAASTSSCARFEAAPRAAQAARRTTSATSIGLFEQTSPHYGEIWYELDGRR